MLSLQLKLPQIQKIMMEFEKQSEIMEMKEEMMNDAIDDAMGDEDDEEEGEAIVNQVLDELGLQVGDQLAGMYTLTATSLELPGRLYLFQPLSVQGWISAFLLAVHRLCGAIEGRLSHLLPR